MDLLTDLRARMARLERLLSRTVRVGEVAEVEAESARVKVVLRDEDDLLTTWLPVLHQRVEHGDDYALPQLGSQVLAVFLPIGPEDGFVLGGFYSQADVDAGFAPKDPHTRRLAGDWLELLAETAINLTAPDIDLTATNDVLVTAPTVTVDAGLVQLGSPTPADHAALASKVQDMLGRISSMLTTMGPLGNFGIPVAFATDLLGLDGAGGAGGAVAVTTIWQAPLGPIDQIASSVVEID